MSFIFSPAQLMELQALRDEGKWPEAYAYIANALDPAVSAGDVDGGVQFWFSVASDVNGNADTWLAQHIRKVTKNGGLFRGNEITDERFQEVSDQLAESVVNDILAGSFAIVNEGDPAQPGFVPTTARPIVEKDVDEAVRELGIEPEDWSGTLIAPVIFNTPTIGDLIEKNKPGTQPEDATAIAAQVGVHAFTAVENVIDPLLESIRGKTESGSSRSSPLVLDIDGSGTIDLINISASEATFDIDDDGFAELMGWDGLPRKMAFWQWIRMETVILTVRVSFLVLLLSMVSLFYPNLTLTMMV